MIHDKCLEAWQYVTATQLFSGKGINDVSQGVFGYQEQKALRVNANDLKVFLVITQAVASSPQDSWNRWKIPELKVDSVTGCFFHLPWYCPLLSEYWLYFAFCRPAFLLCHCMCLETPQVYYDISWAVPVMWLFPDAAATFLSQMEWGCAVCQPFLRTAGTGWQQPVALG